MMDPKLNSLFRLFLVKLGLVQLRIQTSLRIEFRNYENRLTYRYSLTFNQVQIYEFLHQETKLDTNVIMTLAQDKFGKISHVAKALDKAGPRAGPLG